MTAAPEHAADVAVIKLTRFQEGEVAHGISIDRDDGNPDWGWIEYRGRASTPRWKRQAYLHVTDRDGAVYRVTSSRDIWQDNAADGDMTYAAGARSMAALADALVAAVGGRAALKPETRRWV